MTSKTLNNAGIGITAVVVLAAAGMWSASQRNNSTQANNSSHDGIARFIAETLGAVESGRSVYSESSIDSLDPVIPYSPVPSPCDRQSYYNNNARNLLNNDDHMGRADRARHQNPEKAPAPKPSPCPSR